MKKNNVVEVLAGDLRMLLFWSSVGVSQSRGGTYAVRRGANDSISDVMKSYANSIGYKLPYGSEFKK